MLNLRKKENVRPAQALKVNICKRKFLSRAEKFQIPSTTTSMDHKNIFELEKTKNFNLRWPQLKLHDCLCIICQTKTHMKESSRACF